MMQLKLVKYSMLILRIAIRGDLSKKHDLVEGLGQNFHIFDFLCMPRLQCAAAVIHEWLVWMVVSEGGSIFTLYSRCKVYSQRER